MNNNSHKANARGRWRALVVALMCLVGALQLSAQTRGVQGIVVDSSGVPVVGALVRGNDSNIAAISLVGGKFTIKSTSGEKLTVTSLGYRDAIVTVGAGDMRIVLEPTATALEDVVVVGYGTQKKATLTGAVSSVNNKEIMVTKNENVVNMLSGKLPGVRIMQTSAQPGDYDNNFKIDIRGMGEPLVVVDGIPRDKGYFARMDASEIDNVSVLKDASAAIYGVGGGNGVLLVTTKRGNAESGKFNITFSANYGWQNFLYQPKTSSALDHMQMINEKKFNDFGKNYPVRTAPAYTYERMMPYVSGEKQSTNWTDELFAKNVPQQQYNVSLDGGSDRVRYFFNAGYMDQQGSYKSGSLNYNRWNFRSNVDVNITKRLRANVSLGGFLDERNEPNTGIWTVYKFAWISKPTAPAWFDGNHDYPVFDSELPDKGLSNPVATTDSRFTGYRKFKKTNLDGSFSLTYDIPGVKGLNVKGLYNYTYTNDNNTQHLRKYSLWHLSRANTDDPLKLTPQEANPKPFLCREASPGSSQLMIFSLNYANKFGDHNVGGLLAWEQCHGEHEGYFGQTPMEANTEYIYFGEKDGVDGGGTGAPGEWTRKAFLGRATYDWKGRYMAEFAFRYDGSSNFSKLGVWGFFPSGSIGWRISEEPWVKNNISWMTNLKLRASYGLLGDDGGMSRAIQGYKLEPSDIAWLYGPSNITGVRPTETPNPDLTWLVIKTLNVGLDFDLWNGRLSGSADVFQRIRSGIPERPTTQVPSEVGAQLPQINKNSDMTFGWEFTLGHHNRIGAWSYWVNAQVSATKNRWVKREDSEASNSMDMWKRRDASGRNRDIWFTYEEGGRFNSYEDIRYHNTTGGGYGQNTLPGDYWYKDWNGDGVINGDDEHPVATYNLPVFNYGLTIGAGWKGIDLSVHFQGAAGVYNSYDEVFTEVGPFEGGAVLDIYKDRWHTVNPTDDPWNPNTQWIKGYYPATGHNFKDGTTGIKDCSYIRLKSAELGYTFPSKWMSKIGLRDFRVYVSGYNLLTFSGNKYMDPERPGRKGGANKNGDEGVLFYNYPVNRTINIGASLKF